MRQHKQHKLVEALRVLEQLIGSAIAYELLISAGMCQSIHAQEVNTKERPGPISTVAL